MGQFLLYNSKYSSSATNCFTFVLFFLVTEAQLGEKIKTLLKEKTEILEKLSEYDQKVYIYAFISLNCDMRQIHGIRINVFVHLFTFD